LGFLGAFQDVSRARAPFAAPVTRIVNEKKAGGSVRELAYKTKPVKRHHRVAAEHEPKPPGRMIGSDPTIQKRGLFALGGLELYDRYTPAEYALNDDGRVPSLIVNKRALQQGANGKHGERG
jgi:hypothetical protein